MASSSSSSSSGAWSPADDLHWVEHGAAAIADAAASRNGADFASVCADAGRAFAASYGRAGKPARAALEATLLEAVRVGPPPHHDGAAAALEGAVSEATKAMPAHRRKRLARAYKEASILRARAAAAAAAGPRPPPPPDLPRDVLLSVRALLPDPGDRAAFAATCVDWRNVSREDREAARPAVEAARAALAHAVCGGGATAVSARLRFWDIGGAG